MFPPFNKKPFDLKNIRKVLYIYVSCSILCLNSAGVAGTRRFERPAAVFKGLSVLNSSNSILVATGKYFVFYINIDSGLCLISIALNTHIMHALLLLVFKIHEVHVMWCSAGSGPKVSIFE